MSNFKIALAGNPNVGKSTIYNYLTKSNQHTGNWSGKTVDNALGIMKHKSNNYYIYDLPGIYSLLPHSEEERLARDFLAFEEYDYIIVVCDSTNLLRNLNLVLQLKELGKDIVLCLNLIDEAKKNNIVINTKLLSILLDVKVIEVCGHDKKSLRNLKEEILDYQVRDNLKDDFVKYPELEKYLDFGYNRFLNINILRKDKDILNRLNINTSIDIKDIDDLIVDRINSKALDIFNRVVVEKEEQKKDNRLDKIFTSRITGVLTMVLFLGIILFLTIKISNYPSSLLFYFFSNIEKYLLGILDSNNLLIDLFINGIYKVTTWVISVMLPPMMIFFPLFTLLEDFGYLPRIAFNLDGIFKKCSSCGKQALTMAMGFGCNCVGVTGCRIIDSKRERLIAILTNGFIPCNGKFPSIIALITMFIIGNSFLSTGFLLLLILLCFFISFLISKFLSKTFLKGYSSSFILELPSYRKPRIIKTIIKSIYERTMIVLFRAIVVAIPCGVFIWLLSNIDIMGISVLNHLIRFFTPIGNFFGLDGVIILAFILGFPANEIVIPIMLMCYLNSGTLVEYSNLMKLKMILVNNGWTIFTAISVILLFLFHYPCSTACLTIKKETNSWFYTFLAMIIPTIIGLGMCFIVKVLFAFFG